MGGFFIDPSATSPVPLSVEKKVVQRDGRITKQQKVKKFEAKKPEPKGILERVNPKKFREARTKMDTEKTQSE